MYIDLHTHSYFSDGTMSPEEIVIEAKKKGVGTLSITDHNRLEAWKEIQEVAKSEGVKVIKGVEINVKYQEQVLHILAYGFKENIKLISLIEKADKELNQMSVDLVKKLSKEYTTVSIDDYERYQYNPRKGGWKGIHYLLDRQITTQLFEGFKYYKAYECDFTDYNFPALEEVCKAIEEAGGYAVLAHPAEYYKNLEKEQLIKVLTELKEKGIQGVECYYPTHSKLMTQTCLNFCKENNLLITTGSDEHGEFGKEAKAIEQTIGCMKITLDQVNLGGLI